MGAAMNTKLYSHYANFFISYLDEEFSESCYTKSALYLLFIDVIFINWTEHLDLTVDFLYRFNNYHPLMKISLECSYTNINNCIEKNPWTIRLISTKPDRPRKL